MPGTLSCGISTVFTMLSPSLGQVAHVLLTRSPLREHSVPKYFMSSPFDLHVLGTPPAFVLSQDQTLKFIPGFYPRNLRADPCATQKKNILLAGYASLPDTHRTVRSKQNQPPSAYPFFRSTMSKNKFQKTQSLNPGNPSAKPLDPTAPTRSGSSPPRVGRPVSRPTTTHLSNTFLKVFDSR